MTLRAIITRGLAVLGGIALLLVWSPGTAFAACGINYATGDQPPDCGGTATSVGIAAVATIGVAAALAPLAAAALRATTNLADMATLDEAIATARTGATATGDLAAVNEALTPTAQSDARSGRSGTRRTQSARTAPPPSRASIDTVALAQRLQAAEAGAAQAAEYGGQGRLAEAAAAAEQAAALLEGPVQQAEEVVDNAGRVVEAARTALSRAGASGGTAAPETVALLDATADVLSAADSALTAARHAARQAAEGGRAVRGAASGLRAASASATGGPVESAENLPATVRAVGELIHTAALRAVEAITSASAAGERVALAENLTAPAPIRADAAQAASKAARLDRVGAVQAARVAAARGHELAHRIGETARGRRAAGRPSPALEAAAQNAARVARDMTALADQIEHADTLRGAQQRAGDLVRTADALDRIAASAAGAVPPDLARQWLGASASPQVNPHLREQGFELGDVAGQTVRSGSGFMESARFFDGARTASGRRVSRIEQAKADAIRSPGSPVRPEAAAQRQVVADPDPLSPGQRFQPKGEPEGEPKGEPNTDYEVVHQHTDGRNYRATYRTDERGVIAEIWTPSGFEIHAGAPGAVQPNPELNEPRPNCVYHVDDRFTYITDASGRTAVATATLRRVKSDGVRRDPESQRDIGHEGVAELGGRDRYDGGHIFATEYAGPLERINVVPELRATNRMRGGATPLDNWRRYEVQVEDMLRDGREVRVTIELPYQDVPPAQQAPGGHAYFSTPSGFLLTYVVDGVRQLPRPYVNLPPGANPS